jgi:hypothetical protein
MNKETARALTEAGYMPASEYVRLFGPASEPKDEPAQVVSLCEYRKNRKDKW